MSDDWIRGTGLDLNLFRVFVAIYRAGSITRAAAELRLTQPAVSNALSRLRDALDDPLFVRSGRGVAPTPRARAMVEGVSRALELLGEAAGRERSFDPTEATHRIRVGMHEVVESALLPPLAERLLREAPGVSLHTARVQRRALARELASGELDLAVDVATAVGEDVRQKVLFRDDLCLLMRRDHPLAGRRITVDRWVEAQHVAASARPSGPVLEDLALRQLGRTREVSVRCQSWFAACELVSRTDFVLTAMRSYATWVSGYLPLEVARLPVDPPPVELVLYWHGSVDADPAHAWLRARVEEVMSGPGPARPRRGARVRSRPRSG